MYVVVKHALVGYWTRLFRNNVFSAGRIASIVLLASIIVSMALPFVNGIVGATSDMEVLCKYVGSDSDFYIELLEYRVYGPENPRVGDDLVVFFTFKYIGKTQAVLEKVYVGAVLPSGNAREYEDESFRGRILRPGDIVKFHIEIPLTMKGVWRLWPSIEYGLRGSKYTTPSYWHECSIIVLGKEETTTTTRPPLPDIAFNPSYTQPLGYDRCRGFYAHVKNTGLMGVGEDTVALFNISYRGKVIDSRRTIIPVLRVGEETTIYSGPFIGVPGHDYTVTVVLDSDNRVDEISEYNVRRLTIRYSSSDLPLFNLEVRSLRYTGSSITFTVKHTGCIDSPQTIAHLGARIPPSNDIVELDSLVVPSLSGLGEVELSFSDISRYINENPELSRLSAVELHVWVDVAEVVFNVEGQEITIREHDDHDNEQVLRITTSLVIEGPDKYFLERRRGSADYIIPNPKSLWRAVGGLPGRSITYDFTVEGCNARVSTTGSALIITVPGPCSGRGITLRVTASSGGVVAEKNVDLLFYNIVKPRSREHYLYSSCIGLSGLGAREDFVFADDPVEVFFYPPDLLLPVTYTHASGQMVTYEEAEVELTIEWSVNGVRRTYTIPQDEVYVDWSRNRIVFTIPDDVVFNNIDSKAVQANIVLRIKPGSGQEIRYSFNNYWVHRGRVLQVYLRSFNFPNSGCPYVSWDMWEKFWGTTAVYDCITEDFCLWKDPGSYIVYEYVFKKMCGFGRCFSFALSGQKFYESDVYVCGYCGSSTPTPFALDKYAVVCTSDICEAAGEEDCPSRMVLDTYLTYEYMWSLDERNVRRGLDKFERYLLGEDIVLETLNELREWENLPEELKWSNPYIIMMIPPNLDEITNAHAVLAYRVEEIDENHVRVWIVDSNRPFQPNSYLNQEESYIDFYCCGSDGRWNYVFRFGDGRVLSDFLYATPTDLFEGESSAITTLDVLKGLGEYFNTFMKLLGRLGSAVNTTQTPTLYIVYSTSKVDYIQVKDSMGKRLFNPTTSGFEDDLEKMSARIALIPLPAPVYMFISSDVEPVSITLKTLGGNDDYTILLSENGVKATRVEYWGGMSELNNFTINSEIVVVSGISSKGFMITSQSVDETSGYRVVVSTRPGFSSIKAVFKDNGSLKIVNLDDSELVFDLRLSIYDPTSKKVVSEDFDGLKASPQSTLEVIPESWSSVEGGRIIVRVDEGSDGVIDYEEVVKPRNIRPVAVAEDVYVYANETGYARVVLNGSQSYSPLNKTLTWTWRGDFLEGREVEGKVVEVTMTTGVWVVELTVSDGELESIPKEILVHVLPSTSAKTNTTTPLIQSSSTTNTAEEPLRFIKDNPIIPVSIAFILITLAITALLYRARRK